MQDAGRVRFREAVGDAGEYLDHLPPRTLAAKEPLRSVPPSTNSLTMYWRPP